MRLDIEIILTLHNYLPDSKCQNDNKVNQLFDESALVSLARVLPMTEHLIHIKAVVA